MACSTRFASLTSCPVASVTILCPEKEEMGKANKARIIFTVNNFCIVLSKKESHEVNLPPWK
jgi:hypothetical protein